MKTTKSTRVLNKVIIIISKIVEVFCWVGTALLAIGVVGLSIGKTEILPLISTIDLERTTNVEAFGFSMDIAKAGDPAHIISGMIVFLLTALIGCVFMALVFRNTNLIFKTAEGNTKFAEGTTPFQKPVVRMMTQIGILLIAAPIVQAIMSVIGGAVSGGAIDMSVNGTQILIGLVVIALAQYFKYGMELQNDVDGLV